MNYDASNLYILLYNVSVMQSIYIFAVVLYVTLY